MQETCRQSSSLLEERDFIGLSDASFSTKTTNLTDEDSPLHDTDLTLGLGLGLAAGSICKHSALLKDSLCGISGRLASNQLNVLKRGFSEVAGNSVTPSLQLRPQSASDVATQDADKDDCPPSKDQVVGWPPVRLYRRQTLFKSSEMFVKVNMDGMTVGRKVDLNAYKSYDGLLLALEEMFRALQGGRDADSKSFLLSSDTDFVLTYEDKDGDWMLVGDVPWSMFTSTVKRLRISRTSEANGTVSRRSLAAKGNCRV